VNRRDRSDDGYAIDSLVPITGAHDTCDLLLAVQTPPTTHRDPVRHDHCGLEKKSQPWTSKPSIS